MINAFRRYEILLPLRFNDGHPVSDDLISDCVFELRQQFGAVTCETQTTRGVWQHQELEFRDDLMRVYVDVNDTPEARTYFTELKGRLRARFQQIEIWMTTYPIEII